MKRLNTLFFLSNLRGGGVQRTVTNILKHIDQTRFACTVAVFNYDREQAFAGQILGNVDLADLKAPRARSAVGKVADLLRRTRPDIVFSILY